MDTEISPSHPEFWREGISDKTFSEGNGSNCLVVEIVKYNIQADHIHMMMIIPPKYAVSAVVGKMKGDECAAN